MNDSQEDADGLEAEMPYVRITNKPMSCCGVIQQGWEGQVAYTINTTDMAPDIHSDIHILTDGTLVWGHHCKEIPKPRMN